MKRSTKILLFIVFAVSCFAQENLIKNAGFEIGENGKITNWEISNAEKDAVSRTNENYTGNYAVKISHEKESSYSSIRQVIDVEPNTDYTASVMVQGMNLVSQPGGLGFKLFIGDYPTANSISHSGTNLGSFGWTRVSIPKFNTGPRSKIWVYCYLHNTSGAVWVDDINLMRYTEELNDEQAKWRRRNRLQLDLNVVKTNWEKLVEKGGNTAQVEVLKTEINELEKAIIAASFKDPFDYMQGPPYNALHEQIFIINGKIFDIFFPEKEFLIWIDDKWAPLMPLQFPLQADKLCLSEDLMLNEWDSIAFNITNTTPQKVTLTLTLPDLTNGNIKFPIENLIVREVIFVESITQQMQADALILAQKGQEVDSYLVDVPPGSTVQIWIQINGKGFYTPGFYDGIINVVGKSEEKAYLTIKFWPITFPEEPTLYSCNWSYLTWPILAGKEKEAVDDLFEHYTNIFVIHHYYLPWPKVDQSGNIIDIDFSRFDELLDKLQGARMFLIWPAFEEPHNRCLRTNLEYMTPEWEKAFEQWVSAIVNHLDKRGISKKQFAFYPVDEPSGKKRGFWLETARKIKEIDPGILVYSNETIRESRLDDLYETAQYADILSPCFYIVTPSIATAYQQTGKNIWTYNTLGPAKNLSPIDYYRLQAWAAWVYGFEGVGFWAYADTGWPSSTYGKSAWDDFDGKGADYSIIYESPCELVPSKRWEAWRDGIEDYEYMVMLEKELNKHKDSNSGTVQKALYILEDIPKKVHESRSSSELISARRMMLEILSEFADIE